MILILILIIITIILTLILSFDVESVPSPIGWRMCAWDDQNYIVACGTKALVPCTSNSYWYAIYIYIYTYIQTPTSDSWLVR